MKLTLTLDPADALILYYALSDRIRKLRRRKMTAATAAEIATVIMLRNTTGDYLTEAML